MFSFGQNFSDKFDSQRDVLPVTQCQTFTVPFLKTVIFAKNVLESFFTFPSILFCQLLFGLFGGSYPTVIIVNRPSPTDCPLVAPRLRGVPLPHLHECQMCARYGAGCVMTRPVFSVTRQGQEEERNTEE